MATAQNTSSLISSVYKSRSILLDLMKMQGYNVDEYEGFSVSEVNTMKTNNQLDMILEKKKVSADEKRQSKIYLRYYLAKSLRPQNLQEMIDKRFILLRIKYLKQRR